MPSWVSVRAQFQECGRAATGRARWLALAGRRGGDRRFRATEDDWPTGRLGWPWRPARPDPHGGREVTLPVPPPPPPPPPRATGS